MMQADKEKTMNPTNAAKKITQPKPGGKEEALRAMRKTGTLPKHAAVMLDDGAPPDIIRLPGDKPSAMKSAVATGAPVTKRDFRIPKGMSDEEGRAYIEQLVADKKRKTLERIAKLRESKGLSNEPARAEQPAASVAATQAEAKPAAEQKETDVRKTTSKKSAKAKARTAVKGNVTSARSDGLREGSKQATILDLILMKSGASEPEICKKLGWEKCRATVHRVCERVGAKLSCIDGRFFAVLPQRKRA
jgi:hypothetical protein